MKKKIRERTQRSESVRKSDGVLGGAIGVNVTFDLSWCGDI